ncbi:MAG: hypothetical protein WC365_04925 [Candidatus Babeliales bacterium]|jgi:hypothetical protein
MSDQKIKDMGNLSRTAGEMKKKLELSFTPMPETPINQNTEIGKGISTELPKYGKSDLTTTSIHTENGNSVLPHVQDHLAAAMAKTGSRYKNVIPRASGAAKAKATFCLDTVAAEQLNLIYIKRLSTHQKSDRSSLICEAISLLFEKEKP